MVTDSGRDDPEPVVHPTQDDPVAAALSRSVGGPIGDHAGHHPWWTPVRVVLAMVAVVCALGFVQKAPCYHTEWTNQQAQYSDLCYSDLPYLYVGRGFAELDWPYSDAISVRDRYSVMEYPVGIAYYAWGTAYLTHWLSGSPNLDARGGFSQDQLSRDPQVRTRDDALRRGDRDRVRAVRAARGVVPGRRPPTPTLGRRAVRGSRRSCCSRASSTGTCSRWSASRARSGPMRAAARP